MIFREKRERRQNNPYSSLNAMTDFSAGAIFKKFVASNGLWRGFHKMFHVEHTGSNTGGRINVPRGTFQ